MFGVKGRTYLSRKQHLQWQEPINPGLSLAIYSCEGSSAFDARLGYHRITKNKVAKIGLLVVLDNL